MSWFAGAVICLVPAATWPQEKPLERSFSARSVDHYRVRLTIRSELKGQAPVQRAGAVYLQAFTRAGEGRLEWLATERVAAVAADGSAEIEETLDHFSVPRGSQAVQDESAPGAGDEPVVAGSHDGPLVTSTRDRSEAQKLVDAIVVSLRRWSEPRARILHYTETRQGEVVNVKRDGVPGLDEAAPVLLELWLRRALRPTAPLPAKLVRVGARWLEPRSLKFDGWSDVHALETGEWLAADAPEPAARLLVVQQIVGTVVAGSEKPPEGSAQGSFHGESLMTAALNDGSLLAATRSAAREISWKLAPVAGLVERPEFRARLSVEVEIERCTGPCLQ